MNREQEAVQLSQGSIQDVDPQETAEWLEALRAVIRSEGPERAEFLMQELLREARHLGATPPYNTNTPYVNTIPRSQQLEAPGDH